MVKLRTEDDIISNWEGDISTPLLNITCTAFNHGKFIRETLNGFLIQETNFPYKIIIHDDASSDNTALIIREYEEKYPRIIKAIYQTENQYSKGVKAGGIIRPYLTAKYIAKCEGDDYWVDPRKLQIQVDFLENNPEYVISGHDAKIVDEDGNILQESKLPMYHKRNYSAEELLKGKAWILTLTRVSRNILDRPFEVDFVKNGDFFTTTRFGLHGKSKYHNDIENAVYRVHSGGIWSMIPQEKKDSGRIETFFWISKYFKRVGMDKFARYHWNKFLFYSIQSARTVEVAKAILYRVFKIDIAKRIVKKLYKITDKIVHKA